MNINHFVVTVLLVAATSYASAQAYKCAGPGGKIEYRDIPCSSVQKVEKTFYQEPGPSTPTAPRAVDSTVVPAGAAATDDKASRHASRSAAEQTTHETDSSLATNPGTTLVESRSGPIAGGVCSGNLSWDTCRKLGIDSVVDCKRMDEDAVFRAGVLQSKGIQCRTYPDHPVRTR